MKEQVLSIEQMKHLQELGINIEVDSKYLNWGKLINVFKLALGVSGIPVCRAFTLQDMLEMMPLDIELSHPYENLWQCTYNQSGEDKSLNGYILREDKSAMECCYNMLCYLAEKNLLGKEEKK